VPGVGGSVAKGVQIAYFLCDNAQLLAGAEALYLRAEDLAKGHVPDVERGPVCESGAAGSSSPPLQKTYLQINHLLDVQCNSQVGPYRKCCHVQTRAHGHDLLVSLNVGI